MFLLINKVLANMVTTTFYLLFLAVLFAIQRVYSQNLLTGNNDAFFFCSYSGNPSTQSPLVPITDQMFMTEMGNNYYNVSADYAGYCLSPTDCATAFSSNTQEFDSYTIVLNIINPISPKSILPVLAKAMTSLPAFSDPATLLTVSLSVQFANSTTKQIFSVQGSSQVGTLKRTDGAITQISLTLSGLDSLNPINFCVDRVFAFQEYFLNKYRFATDIRYKDPTIDKVVGYNFKGEVNDPLNDKFTRGVDCMTENIQDATVFTTLAEADWPTLRTTYWTHAGGNLAWNNQMLVTQLFIQTGLNQGKQLRFQQYCLYSDNTAIVSNYPKNPSIRHQESNSNSLHQLSQNVATDSWQWFLLPWPQYNASMCSFLQFGYRFCLISSLTATYKGSTADTISLTADPNPQITVNYTGLIENSGIDFPAYCQMRIYGGGSVAYLNGVALSFNDTQYAWEASQSSFNYTIIPQSFLVLDVYQTYSFYMKVFDVSDPNKATPEQTSTITLKYCEAEFQKPGYITFGNGTNFTNFIYYHGYDVEQIAYEITPPVCQGYLNNSATYSAIYLDEGTTITTDSYQFENCLNSSNHICFYHNLTAQSIYMKTQWFQPYYNTTVATIKIASSYTLIDYYNKSTTGQISQSLKINQLTPSPLVVCNVISMSPQVSEITKNYILGSGSLVIAIPQYTQTPACGYQFQSVTISQKRGPSVPFSSITTSNKQISLNIKDPRFIGAQAAFMICAVLSNPSVLENCDLVFVINFLESNAPYLKSIPQTASDIPCLKLTQAQSWSYTFPAAYAKSMNSLNLLLKCPVIQSIISTTVVSNVMTVTLNTKVPIQVPPGKYSCKLYMTDPVSNSQSTEDFDFQVNCPSYLSENDLDSQNQANQKGQIPVQAEITQISNLGLVTLRWNQKMIVPSNTTIKDLKNFYQMLVSSKAISVNLLPGTSQTDRSLLNFTYYIANMTSQQIQIQLNFSTPYGISIGKIKDQIKIQFSNSDYFISESGVSITPNFSLQSKIPSQKAKGEVEVNVQQVVQASLAAIVLGFIGSYFLQAVVNQLLQLVDSMILIVHMSLVSLSYPSNLQNFYAQIFPFVTFDVLPVNNLYEKMFKFSQIKDNSVSDIFNSVGYNYTNLSILNLNSIYVYITFGPIIMFVLFLFKKYELLERYPYWQDKINSIYSQNAWNGVIRAYNELFIVITTTALLGIKELRFENSYFATEQYCSFISVALLGLSTCFPIFICLVYFQMFKTEKPVYYNRKLVIKYGDAYINKLEQQAYTHKRHENFLKQYGTLIENINTKRMGVTMSILCSVLPILRQFMIAIAITQLYAKPIMATVLIHFIVLFYTMFQIYNLPYTKKSEQAKSVINEVTLLILNYHQILFTKFVDPQNYALIGNTCIVVVISNVVLNFIVTGSELLPAFERKLKRLYYKYRTKHPKTVKSDQKQAVQEVKRTLEEQIRFELEQEEIEQEKTRQMQEKLDKDRIIEDKQKQFVDDTQKLDDQLKHNKQQQAKLPARLSEISEILEMSQESAKKSESYSLTVRNGSSPSIKNTDSHRDSEGVYHPSESSYWQNFHSLSEVSQENPTQNLLIDNDSDFEIQNTQKKSDLQIQNSLAKTMSGPFQDIQLIDAKIEPVTQSTKKENIQLLQTKPDGYFLKEFNKMLGQLN